MTLYDEPAGFPILDRIAIIVWVCFFVFGAYTMFSGDEEKAPPEPRGAIEVRCPPPSLARYDLKSGYAWCEYQLSKNP